MLLNTSILGCLLNWEREREGRVEYHAQNHRSSISLNNVIKNLEKIWNQLLWPVTISLQMLQVLSENCMLSNFSLLSNFLWILTLSCFQLFDTTGKNNVNNWKCCGVYISLGIMVSTVQCFHACSFKRISDVHKNWWRL